jgi:hypothetical protein
MLHTETVEPKTLELLIRLMKDTEFDNFVLVGGTSLALQLGHRISVDIDLFNNESFDSTSLVEHLRENYEFELDYLNKGTIKGESGGVKIDCIAHKYQWLNSPYEKLGIRMAGFEDLAAMKLNVIVGNGTRIKDYIDIAYLSCSISLSEMLNAYQQKYQSNPVIGIKAITYFEDIDFNEPIKMLDKENYDWKKIRKHFELMLKFPAKIFDSIGGK